MSTPHPLPPGGGPPSIGADFLRTAATEASLIVHSPPDIQSNFEVLGICAVPEEYSSPQTYGWIVADFLAWKTLFYGVGTRKSQTWLSSLDIGKALQGGSYTEDMVNKVLGANKDHITALPTDSKECAEVLFKSISERAQEADKKGACLFVMIFAPTTPEQDVVLEFDGMTGRKAYLTMDKIRTVIQDSVKHDHLPVMLMTPSPFTGGWLCNPSLFVSQGGNGDAAHLSQFVAKSCGAAFANRIIKAYTTRSSPFLSDLQKKTLKYEDLTPIRPSAAQVSSLHEFHRKIHEALEHRLCDLAGKHSFDFTVDNDNWAQTYAHRKGFPLIKWESRWTRASVDQEDDCFSFLGGAFGGSRASQLFHMSYLACIETQTCPGDWKRPVSYATRALFDSFRMTENPDEDTVKRVFDAMEYRSSCLMIAQMLVKGLGLPVPDGGVKCRYWVDDENAFDDVIYNKFQRAFSEIHNLFDQVALLPGEARHDYKAVKFLRPARWLAASVAQHFADTGGSGEEIAEFVRSKIAPFMRLIRTTQDGLLRKNDTVQKLGVKWITSLGYEADLGSQSHEVSEEKHGATTTPTPPDNDHGAVSMPTPHGNDQGAISMPTSLDNNEGAAAMPTHLDNKRKRVDTGDSNVDLATKKPLSKKPVQVHTADPESSCKSDKLASPVKNVIAKGVTVSEEKNITEEPFENKPPGPQGEQMVGQAKDSASNDGKSSKACDDVHETGGLDSNPGVAAPGQSSTAFNTSFADLATIDLEALVNSNPVVIAQVLAKALALLRLEEARTGTNLGASSATANVSGVTRGLTQSAAESPAPEVVRPALVNPTPPQTPFNGRESENIRPGSQKMTRGGGVTPGSQAKVDTAHRPLASGRLADPNEFWKSVNMKSKK